MRVLLVNPLHPSITVDRPTLGIAYLAAALSRLNGVEVRILDLTVDRMKTSDFVSLALQYKPKMVGFSMLTSTAMITKKLALELKKALNSAVYVVGGPHPSAAPYDAMAGAPFDVAVIGEGEFVIVELAKNIAMGANPIPSIAGTHIRHSDGSIRIGPPPQRIQNLDSLPLPARHLLPLNKYTYTIDGMRATMICSSRGCPHSCVYCDQSVFGQATRFRSPDNLLAEIKEIYSNGYRAFDIIDDTFTLNRDRVMEICEGIIRMKIDVVWRCLGRVDQVDPEMLRVMHLAGCRQIYYGLESGSQRTLDKLGKRTTVSQIRDAVRATKDVDIRVKAFFMIGLPWETSKDVTQTLSLATELPLDGGKFSLPKPLPNTALMKLLQDEGRLLHTNSATLAYYTDDHDQIFTYEEMTHEQVMAFLNKARSLRKGLFNG